MVKFIVKHKLPIAVVIGVGLICAVLLALVYLRVIKLNAPSRKAYPVRGADVSSYQGDIDWAILSENLDFVFIKATEGSKHLDGKFAYNYAEARGTDLRVGAYHFFSFESGGDTQADNYIANVEKFDGMLPPVVDVELYGDYRADPLPAEDVVPQLKTLLEKLEEHYGVKPIIYATGTAYNMYVKEDLADYDLWIRSVYFKPESSKQWTFWQYSDTATLDGYDGEEKHIDLNVFNGSAEEFKKYGCAE